MPLSCAILLICLSHKKDRTSYTNWNDWNVMCVCVCSVCLLYTHSLCVYLANEQTKRSCEITTCSLQVSRLNCTWLFISNRTYICASELVLLLFALNLLRFPFRTLREKEKTSENKKTQPIKTTLLLLVFLFLVSCHINTLNVNVTFDRHLQVQLND